MVSENEMGELLDCQSNLEAWPPKTVSKLEFTPDDRKRKERILEWEEML
jgi:hypothetical protein